MRIGEASYCHLQQVSLVERVVERLDMVCVIFVPVLCFVSYGSYVWEFDQEVSSLGWELEGRS
jgi:hypothetical protein